MIFVSSVVFWRRLLYVMDVSKTSQRRLVLTGLKEITNNEKEFVFFNQVFD